MGWIYHGTPELEAQSTYKVGLIVCIVVPVIMAIVVGLRVYTRFCVVCRVGADDYLTIAAVRKFSASTKAKLIPIAGNMCNGVRRPLGHSITSGTRSSAR